MSSGAHTAPPPYIAADPCIILGSYTTAGFHTASSTCFNQDFFIAADVRTTPDDGGTAGCSTTPDDGGTAGCRTTPDDGGTTGCRTTPDDGGIAGCSTTPDNGGTAGCSPADACLAQPVLEDTDICVIIVSVPCILEISGCAATCPEGNILITKGDYPIKILHNEAALLPALLLKQDFFDSMFLFQITDCPLFYDLLHPASGPARLLHFDCIPSDMSWTIARILFYEAAKIPQSIKTVHAACTLLFSNLHQIHREKLLIGNSDMISENKIGEILTYMSNHYRTITLESAAAAFHYHPAYFSSLFKKKAKITFQRQLLKIRLEQARTLLRETTLPVQTIIEEVGFREKSYFHRCFKREVGMTPLAYRKRAGM